MREIDRIETEREGGVKKKKGGGGGRMRKRKEYQCDKCMQRT